MPFCNSCGSNVNAGAGACPKCGAAMPGAAPAAPAAAAPAKSGGGVVRVLLIILGVFVLFGVMTLAVMAYAGYRGYKAAKEAQARIGEIKVEMSEGSATTTTGDASKIAQEMEVEVYPGAEAQKGGATVSMGPFSVAGANFVTSDSPSQVADFYKKQYPKATLVSEEGDHYSIVVNTPKGMVTVAIQPDDGKTKISIARVAGARMPGAAQPN